MSVDASMGRLLRAARELSASWEQTRAFLRDDNSRAFEERFLDPLHNSLRATQSTLGHLDEILQRMRRECGEEGQKIE